MALDLCLHCMYLVETWKKESGDIIIVNSFRFRHMLFRS